MEGKSCELTNSMLGACSDNKVFWSVVLKDEPHTFHIVFSVTPVAKRIKITEIEAILLALCNTSSSKCNLTSYKGLTTTLRLVIEKDTRAAEHVVCLPILLHNPKAIELCHCIRTIWMEWSIFILRNFLYLSIEF